MSILWRTLVTLVLLHESFSRKFSPGPSVDPGVFVITHIRTCRNGAGYCILGFSCEVDKDFIKDDLGGHCNGLGAAFNPKASFVCCRENPELHPPQEIPTATQVTNIESPKEPSEEQEIVVENNNAVITETSIATEIITETFTEIIEPVTEVVLVTQIDEVTEEILRPGTVEDLENPALDDNLFAPGIEDISDPALEEISAPQELLAPVLEDISAPVLEEEILTPVLEGNLAPALEEILAPVLEDIIAPVLEEIGVSPALEEEISDDPKLEKVVVPEIFQEIDPGLEKIVPAYRNEPDPVEEPSFILLSTSEDNLDNEKIENIFKTNDAAESNPEEMDQKDKKEPMEEMVEKTTENIADESEDFAIQGLISTSPSDLKPDRDDAFGSILSSTPSSMRSSATNNAGSSILEETTHSDLEVADFAISDSSSELFEDLNLAPQLRFNSDEEENVKIRSGSVRTNQCGRLGGAAVLQAFGRAADNLLPDLVFSWVTGGQSNQKKPTARLNDEDDEQLEPRIIAGDVTSTVLFCWMAAIMEKTKEGEPNQFICTGALVEPDLVVTSASCTLRMFETGVDNFELVLGDSNLNIDLPFGVQVHEISQVIVHENYRPDDSFHYEDIGLIKLQTNAKLETTVCLLCLPETFKDYYDGNCTVVGYGRPSTATINQFDRDQSDLDLTDGILRKADLPIVDTILCQQFLDVNARSDDMHAGFICAGGQGKEESCYIAMDGGSPLACQRGKDQYELAGLVTFGTSCSQDQSPSLFTNVSKHTKWIREYYAKMK